MHGPTNPKFKKHRRQSHELQKSIRQNAIIRIAEINQSGE